MGFWNRLTEALKSPVYSDKELKQIQHDDKYSSASTPPAYQEEPDTIMSDLSYSYTFGQPIEHILANRNALIRQWRDVSSVPEVDEAVEEIVDEALVFEETDELPVQLDLDDLNITNNLKNKIFDSFEKILNLLDFNISGGDLFRQWYIDGVLNLEVAYNNKHITQGIKKLILLPPFDFYKIKYPETGQTEFFYNPRLSDFYKRGNNFTTLKDLHENSEIRYQPDQITQITSGRYSTDRTFSISYLHKCLKVVNQLSLIEDSIVISRVTRAPEKKVFYIDTGRLPRAKAEAYIQNLMNKHRNQMSYNYSTGAVENRKKSISLLEDFWIPRCLSTDTKIIVTDKKGLTEYELTLQEIIDAFNEGDELYTLAISPEGIIEPKLISWAGITKKNTEVIEIELESGKTIRCTPDHKFLVWDDETKSSWHYVEAKDLTEDMELVECE